MDYHSRIIEEIELHNVEGIVECFSNGVSPNDVYNGRPLFYELTSEYARSPRFKECVKAFVDHGLVFADKILLSVLLDDPSKLSDLLLDDPLAVSRAYTLRCAYTPLTGVSLMHICAEFNHVACAKTLLAHGAHVNAIAAVDYIGLGGQTPIFHTVNQNSNNSFEMLQFLIEHGADLELTVKGIIWGDGYPWETFIPAVNPISYAMMGLLPQMHRKSETVSNVVSILLKAAYGIEYKERNIPNKYLG